MNALRKISRYAFRGLLGILISGIFIWLAFRSVDLKFVVERLHSLPVTPILLCLIGQLTFQILHWIRWGLLVRKMGRIEWAQIFILGAIGNAALYILPARSGELVRPTMAARQDDINLGQASATSIVERIVDGLLVCGILFSSLLVMKEGTTPRAVYQSGLLFLGFLLVASAILFFSSMYKEKVIRILRGTIGRISTHWTEVLIGLYDGFVQGIKLLAVGRVLAAYLILSVTLWIIDIVAFYWLFGILNMELPFIAACIAISFLAIGALIPSGPAQMGVFEFSIVLGLEIFAVSAEDAVLVATLFHVIVIGLVLVLGILGLWLDRVKLKVGAINRG